LFLCFSFNLLLCWGYIVTFTEVLTISNISNLNHPFHLSLFSLPHSWKSYFSIYIQA
jgi:hypothetical protein